jgi:uncharacterized membrane protein YsdA (DUF1294 family)/cold shock CspA family protein
MAMRGKGKLVSWHDEKAFGFILPFDSSTQIFIHKSAFSNKARNPEVNDVITYSISSDKQGRRCAAEATYSGEKPLSRKVRKMNKISLYVSLGFLLLLGIASMFNNLPLLILIIYCVLSLLTYGFYAWDKSSAREGSWRTSESTLHLLALAGGWPGAAIAQQRLRHKSQKQAFKVVFWLTVIANIAALYWLVFKSGLVG